MGMETREGDGAGVRHVVSHSFGLFAILCVCVLLTCVYRWITTAISLHAPVGPHKGFWRYVLSLSLLFLVVQLCIGCLREVYYELKDVSALDAEVGN